MKNYLSSVLACFLSTSLLLVGPISVAKAADTPSTPTASERIEAARKAIYAKNWRVALNELREAVKEEPRNADVHNLMGYSYRKQAKPDLQKAFEHYKTALEINPQHLGAHEYIGEAYLMDKNPTEAEKHLAIVEKLCGNKICQEYVELSTALVKYRAASK